MDPQEVGHSTAAEQPGLGQGAGAGGAQVEGLQMDVLVIQMWTCTPCQWY